MRCIHAALQACAHLTRRTSVPAQSNMRLTLPAAASFASQSLCQKLLLQHRTRLVLTAPLPASPACPAGRPSNRRTAGSQRAEHAICSASRRISYKEDIASEQVPLCSRCTRLLMAIMQSWVLKQRIRIAEQSSHSLCASQQLSRCHYRSALLRSFAERHAPGGAVLLGGRVGARHQAHSQGARRNAGPEPAAGAAAAGGRRAAPQAAAAARQIQRV